MGKSVNEYYAEKMKKLLEMQKNDETASQIAAPRKHNPAEKIKRNTAGQNTPPRKKTGQNGERKLGPLWEAAVNRNDESVSSSGRDYYDRFRKGEAGQKRTYEKPKATAETEKAKRPAQTSKAPEQTYEDKLAEEEKREEAEFLARRGKRLRKIRDTAVSVVLIMAVAAVLIYGVYKILFVISDIKVDGNEQYSADEIIAASGIKNGANLYSFRNSMAEKKITLNCPGVGSATIDKVAPSTVNLIVREEKATFYADFYGEYRQMSEKLRVMYATDKEKAVKDGLILLKLPSVSSATSGEIPVFSGVRSDAYIYDVISCVRDSELFGRIVSIDLRNKYSITMNCDGKYLLCVGDTTSLPTKMKIAVKVLADDMFKGNDKAKINVSDLSETSVVVDNQMILD